MLYTVTGESPRRGRLKHLYPRGAFKCKDGYLALNVPDDLIWERLCKTMARDDLVNDPRSTSGTARAANAEFLQPIIENWLAGKTRREAEEELNSQGVPVGPVYTADDVFRSPQVEARKTLVAIDDPVVGTLKFARTPVHLSKCPEIPCNPSPQLGEHTHEILKGLLDYSEKETRVFEEKQVI